MLVKTYGAAVSGIDAIIVTVETVLDRGFQYCIVGLPDTAVKESHERVRSALKQSGMEIPRKSVTINMAPADVKKEGAAYDLPIAVSLLAAAEKLDPTVLSDYVIMGELSLVKIQVHSFGADVPWRVPTDIQDFRIIKSQGFFSDGIMTQPQIIR